jgi:CheY-like chemotaxis protein
MAGNGELVLIVDDYDEGREICAEYLSYHGYQVATAEDGEEALAKARQLRPALILLDLALPKVDGWEVARRLRADEDTSHLVILALTAHALDELGRRALAMGCDGLVTKPVIPRELERRVREALDRARPTADQED